MGELNPYWRPSMNVKFNGGWEIFIWEWDVVRARVFQYVSLIFHLCCVFFAIYCIPFVWYFLSSWDLSVGTSRIYIYIKIKVLPRYRPIAKTVYIYIHSTWYLHWWFLLLDCQVAFWLTRQFQWNSFSKGKCKFQSTVPAQVVAIFFLAYFMVTCCIDAQNKAAIL